MSRLIFDRYEQVEPRGKTAGEGVSGIVIKASDTRAEYGMVAIKRPNPMLSPVDSRKKSAQIKREGEALRRLSHPNACRYIEDRELAEAGGYYLIMGWAEGSQVESRLREIERTGTSFPLGEALEIMDQLADLLAHAHEREVIHNDIDAKHLFWNEPERHLTVIDWANCALGSDARPIATTADDIKQYGELIHRLLTGSTVDSATRLGKQKGGWRVEMDEKQIDPALQHIVARAVGRDETSYPDMRELSTELHQYKLAQNKSYEDKVAQINTLLDQRSTPQILAQVKQLIDEIAVWDPTLVLHERDRLQNIELDRAQNLALVRAKVAVKNEEWNSARQRIEQIFGSDPQAMPLEAQLTYWLAELLDKTEAGSAPYERRKQAAQLLLIQDTPDLGAALDNILLSYGTQQPDYDALLAELARQTGHAYPPLRSRIPQARSQAARLLDLEPAEQIRSYQDLLDQAAGSTNPARPLLEELSSALQEANNLAENAHKYHQANEHFYYAFHLDPHNYHLYWLAHLMTSLERAATADPAEWAKACDELAGREEYGFAAAQYYIGRAKDKIIQFVQRNIEYIRQFRLDTAWTDLESIKQEQLPVSPLIQSVWYICASYRHLYGYEEAGGLDSRQNRLQYAAQAWDQARAENITGGPAELFQELNILTALIEAYRALYETGLPELEALQTRLSRLSQPENHRIVKQLELELERLGTWQEYYQTLLAACLEHRYGQALAYLQQHPETDKDEEVLQWLNPARRPDWYNWQQFCESLHQGLAYWHNQHYNQAHEEFSTAQEHLPLYIDGQVPPALQADLKTIVDKLEALQIGLDQSRSLLTTADELATYQQLPNVLWQAQQHESDLVRTFGGKNYLAASVELADRFVKYARQGDLDKLQGLVEQERFAHDPLLLGYRRIIEVVARARRPGAWRVDVEAALALVPDSQELQQRQVEIERIEQAFGAILKALHWADIGTAQETLIDLKKVQPVLPRWFSCLEQLLTGYTALAGPGQDLPAADRLNQASRSLLEATRLYQPGDPLELRDEIEILTNLLQIYRNIHQQGLGYLKSAKAAVGELQTKQSIVETHEFISRLAADIAALERWQQRRNTLFEDLKQHQYSSALRQLQRVTEQENSSLNWLNEADQPDFIAWETFAHNGQQALALLQAYQYGQAGEALATLVESIPADLAPAMARRLKEQYEAMAVDLRDVQALLDESRRILEEAVDMSAYAQVAEKLARATRIEASYPAHVTGATFITRLEERYRRVRELAEHGQAQELRACVEEAQQAGDPLAPGYVRIRALVEQDQNPTAAPEQVEVARKLAPGANSGDQAGVSTATLPSEPVTPSVLAALHAGDLKAAGQRLVDTPRSASTDCLWQIVAGYQHLHGQTGETAGLADRLQHARRSLAQGNCTAVVEPELQQEAQTLTSLIWAYSEIHSHKLANLETIRQDRRIQELAASQPTHAFVKRLAADLVALLSVKTRWQRLAAYWRNSQPDQAWQEIKQISPAESTALAWLSDEAGFNWPEWQTLSAMVQRGPENWTENERQEARASLERALEHLPLPGSAQTSSQQPQQKQTGRTSNRIKLLGGLAAVAVVIVAGLLALGYYAGLFGGRSGLNSPASMTTPEPQVVAVDPSTATPTPSPTATSTATPVPSPTAVPSSTPTPAPTATPTATSPPTPTPPLLTGIQNRARSPLNILGLARWQDQAESTSTQPDKIYTTPPNYWHVTTGQEAHTFWMDQEFEQFPFEFRLNLNLVEPTSSYGVVLQQVSTGQIFTFVLNADETGQGRFSFIREGEPVESGPVASYDFSQTQRPYNSLSVKVIDNLMAFIINDEEQVYVYQAPEKFSPGWKLGLYAGPQAHAVIGSAYLYQLNPVQ